MASTTWQEGDTRFSADWRSENGVPAPEQLTVVGDELTADQALARLKNGEALLYRGDFRNARQLLSAVSRRLEKKRPRVKSGVLREQFFAEREAKAREAELLSRLCVAVDSEGKILCGHAPEEREALLGTWGALPERTVVSLRELLGVLGAWEWRTKGIEVRALAGRVHPHYGVFGPVRQEYVDVVAGAPSLEGKRVFDVGTGTGVLGILAAKKGAREVIATELDPRAVVCARENVERFGVNVVVEERDLFPEGRADVILFNPPWLPAKPKTRIDRAIFDEGGETLRRFLTGAPAHLNPGGEVWLVISNLAERLGIRREGLLEELWTKAGLKLVSRRELRSTHKRTRDEQDALHAAREGEVTSLFVLVAQ